MKRFARAATPAICMLALIAVCGAGDPEPPVHDSDSSGSEPAFREVSRITPQGRACQQTVLMLLDGGLAHAPVQVPHSLAGPWTDVFAPGVILVLSEDDTDFDRKKPLIGHVEFEDGGESPDGYVSYIEVTTRWNWTLQTVRFKFIYTQQLGLEIRSIDDVSNAME